MSDPCRARTTRAGRQPLDHLIDDVKVDEPRAVQLFTKACDDTSPLGCFQLGLAYGHGRGVAKDRAKARELISSACSQGLPEDNCAAALKDLEK